jgi:hypothetical protein
VQNPRDSPRHRLLAGSERMVNERKVQEMCFEAGFRSVRRVPLENPFNNLYEIIP